MGAPAVSEVALEAREAAEALVAEEREATREEGRGVVDSAPLGAGEETEKWRAGRVRVVAFGGCPLADLEAWQEPEKKEALVEALVAVAEEEAPALQNLSCCTLQDRPCKKFDR